MPTRLKTKDIAIVRAAKLSEQGGRCALCQLPCSSTEAVLDHDHTTGVVRATLHRGCNALLGKVENNYKRYGVRSLAAFTAGAAGYLARHTTDQTGLIHPTHLTEEEKRDKRNAAARKKRAALKGST
jgi:hypothetical protein